MEIVPVEIYNDIKLYNIIFNTNMYNNFHDYTPDEMKYILRTYSYLKLLYRYQSNKMKNMLYKSKNLSFELGFLYLPIFHMLRNFNRFFERYATCSVTGRWLDSIRGIGGVTIFSLMAHGADHIKSGRFKTVGPLWRYYGLEPAKTIRARIIQYNRIPPEIRDCFFNFRTWIKYKNTPVYTDIYKKRLAYEIERNSNGGNAVYLNKYGTESFLGKSFSKNFVSYMKEGKLPIYLLQNRSAKYALKVFIAHFHHVCYVETFKSLPPKPYVLDSLGGHSLSDQIPNWPYSI